MMPYHFRADDGSFITKSFASDEDAVNYGRATCRTIMTESDVEEYNDLSGVYE